MRPDPTRWLPRGLTIKKERLALGNLSPQLHRVEDPGALVDSTDDTSFGKDERFPYWSEVWPSSVALARHLARGPSLVGEEALELGSGTGLGGVAAALKGATVLFTDYEKSALAFCRANHEENLGIPGRVRLFDWRDPPKKLTATLVLASDVLYEARFLGPFVNTLQKVLKPGGRAVVAEPGRKIAEGVVEKLEELGYHRALALEEFVHDGKRHSVWLHTLSRPAHRRS